MTTITFLNESKNNIVILINNDAITIFPKSFVKYDFLADERIVFNAFVNLPSYIKNLLFFKSLVLRYNFFVKSNYEVDLHNSKNATIKLEQKEADGLGFEYYQYVCAFSNEASIKRTDNCVQDENNILPKVKKTKKHEKFGKALMILLNYFEGLSAIVIVGLITFFVAKINLDTKTALIITVSLLIVGTIIALLVGFLINSAVNILDKNNISNKKGYRKKYRKMYKNYKSYFDSYFIEYIINNPFSQVVHK